MAITARVSEHLGDADTEPIRRNLYAAGVVVAMATALGILGVAAEISVQVVCTAVSAGLGELALIVFGVSRARAEAWSPATANSLMDAEAVIAQAEQQ